nr:hypothetical protein [Tanacetum cinerariifolium]
MIDGDERGHVLDYSHVDLHYVKDQSKNLLSMFNSLNQELSSSNVLTLANVSLTLTVSEEIRKVPEKRSTVKAPKEKAQTMSPSASDPIPVKKADSSTKKLLLNMMEEVKDHLGKFDAKADDGFFLGYSPVDKAFRVFNIRRQEMEETYHVTFREDDEAILNLTQKTSILQDSNPFDEHLEITIVYDHPILNEHDDSKLVEDLRIADDQVSSIIEPISNVEPSPTIISPSAKVFINPHGLQDRWSTKKHIELVNILGELQDEVTTRSKIRDSKATSVHECLYVNFLSEIKPKKLIEALKEEGWMIAMQEELNQFERNKMGEHWVVVKNKVRLVAQGYNQQEEIDYDKTFAHAARVKAIRIFFCLRSLHRYQANLKESYLVAIKRIFKYMKGTPNLGLWYPKGSGFNLKSYSDSDYAGCNLDRKSTLRGCQILGGKLMADYDVLYDKVPIFCDKTSATAISNNPVLHCRTKHIDIRYHFIRDHILKGDIELHFVPTELQLADILIKPLAKSSFTRLVAKLDAYINENLKTIKPHHITASTFKPSTAYEVSLTSYMRKVAKLSEQPKKPLILPSNEVNTDTIADKSLSETCVQLGAQSKARTNKKSKKKRNLPSSKPKTSKIVKESSPSTQVADTQNAKEPVTTIDATKGLDAFESKEEQETSLRPLMLKRNIINEAGHFVKEKEVDDEFTDSRISSLGDVTFEELHGNAEESPYDIESEIKDDTEAQSDGIKITLTDSSKDARVVEADFALESMPGDEIESVSGFETTKTEDDDTHSQYKEELSKSEEMAADNLDKNDVNLCELVDLIRDLVVLIDLASAFTKATSKRENKSTQENKEDQPPVVINMPLDQFTDSLFNTSSSEFSPTPLKDDKEEAKAQIKEIKRLEFLKAEKEKSVNKLKVMTPEELEAQAAELAAYEDKREKML